MIISDAALSDIAEAVDWYDGQRPGLGDEFSRHLFSVLDSIERMPEAFAVLRHDVRKAGIGKYPYLIYYRIVGDEVVVIAVLHGKRGPNSWESRV